MSFKWTAAFAGFELVFLAGLGIAIICLWLPERAALFEGRVVGLRERLGWLRWPLILIVATFPGWLFPFSPWTNFFTGNGMRLGVTLFSGNGLMDSVGESLQSATENFLDQAETLATQRALLWERLLPNATFSLGILVGLLVVSLPLILLLVYLVCSKCWRLNAGRSWRSPGCRWLFFRRGSWPA